MTQDAVDCGSHSCAAGTKCGTNNQCLARDAVDCGAGRSCPAGNVCLQGGAECITPAQLAARVEAEKQRKIAEAEERKREAEAKAALDKQLKQQAVVEKKEDREISDWLKKEQARIKTASQRSIAAKASESSVQKSPEATVAKPAASPQSSTVVTIIPGNKPANGQSPSTSTAAHPDSPQSSSTQAEPDAIGKPAALGTSVEIGKPVNIGTSVDVASSAAIGKVVSLGQGTSQIQTVTISIANASKTNSTGSPWTSTSATNSGAENHAYSFSTGTSGVVQVSDQGKLVAITTPTLATLQYGYQPHKSQIDQVSNSLVSGIKAVSPVGSALVDSLAAYGGSLKEAPLWAQYASYTPDAIRVGIDLHKGDALGAAIVATPDVLGWGAGKIAGPLGAAVFQGSFELSNAYVAPYVAPWGGSFLYGLDPSLFTPASTVVVK